MSEESPEYKTRQLVSGRELAKILGYDAPSYIAKLKSQGVLKKCYVPQEGKKHPLIDVETAVQEIEASRDPSKEYVRQRWDQYRAGEQNTQTGVDGMDDKPGNADTKKQEQLTGVDADSAAVANQDTQADEKASSLKQSGDRGDAVPAATGGDTADVLSFQDAKTRKEVYLAKEAQLNYEKKAGQLVYKKLSQATAVECANIVREGLNSIPDRLSQVLAAETDPVQIHTQLTNEFMKVLHALSDRIDRQFVARSDRA